MQKEEELARLQEENNKLKEFLNSSYVKSLEDKSKVCLVKFHVYAFKNGIYLAVGNFVLNLFVLCLTQTLFSVQRSADVQHRKRALHHERDFLNVSRLLQGGEEKRTCRNLSLEFCSAEEVADTPPLDSWVLETLGLQDEDTINTDSSFSSPMTEHRAPSFSSPAPSTDHFSPALQDSTMYSPYSDSHCEYSSAVDSSCGFSHSMDDSADYLALGASRMYTVTSTGSLQGIEVPTGHFTPPKAASTPQRSHVPSSERLHHGRGYVDEGALFSTPHATRSRTDLAFSMSLSPQNSVKTHTFPQGQAFTRRDSQGGWNFTWVPKQCS